MNIIKQGFMTARNLLKNDGISFLELLVVIAIIAVIGSLGILGLSQFRQTATVKQAAREVFSNIETARNKARNSTLSVSKPSDSVLGSKVDAYAVAFVNNNYNLYYCDKSTAIITGLQDYNCGIEIENLKQAIYNDVTITVDPSSKFPCKGVLFEEVSGNMKLFADISVVSTVESSCKIIIGFGNTNLKQVISIDAENNEISYSN